MKASILTLLLAVLLTASSSYAQLTSNRMMKIVTRDTSPDVSVDSFGAQPKTLYRMGETYGRSEEVPDPAQGIHGLMVIAEPKIWMINLWDKTGRLIIDPGPTYVFRSCIIPPEARSKRPPLHDFEFGREYEFLRLHQATKSKQMIEGKTYDSLSASIESYTLKLLSTEGKHQPFRVTVSKAGKIVCQYDYDEYDTDLPPQMDLFTPPDHVKIIESVPSPVDTNSEASIEEFGQRIMTFYQAPTLMSFTQYQKDADRLESLFSGNGSSAVDLLAVAMARISEKHNWPIEGSGIAAKRAEEILEGKSEFACYINNDTAVDPSKLDIWWASFFATGDTKYLQNILKYAGEPMSEDTAADMLFVVGAATWSFKSNCQHHRAVRQFAESQLKSELTPERRAFLMECIEAAKE